MTTFNNMDLNLLRVFDAIATERNLTLAGSKLHLSQPAVSYALGRLRVVFDDPLFIRAKDGMQPTPTALELSKSISRAVQAVQDALRYAEKFDPLVSTRKFHASMTDVAEWVFLPSISEKLCKTAPFTQLQTRQVAPGQLEEALRTGKLDFAIGNLPALNNIMKHTLLFTDTYVCLTRKRSGMPTSDAMTLDDFLSLSHIRIESVESSHFQVEKVLKDKGLSRKIALNIPHYSVLPRILERTDLMVTLPLGIAELFNENNEFLLYQLPVDMPTVDVEIYWHEDFENDNGGVWIRQLIIDQLRDYGSKEEVLA